MAQSVPEDMFELGRVNDGRVGVHRRVVGAGLGPVDDFHPMHSHMDVTFPAPCLGSPVAMSATYCVCAQAEKILRDFDTDGSRSLELAEWEVACRRQPQVQKHVFPVLLGPQVNAFLTASLTHTPPPSHCFLLLPPMQLLEAFAL